MSFNFAIAQVLKIVGQLLPLEGAFPNHQFLVSILNVSTIETNVNIYIYIRNLCIKLHKYMDQCVIFFWFPFIFSISNSAKILAFSTTSRSTNLRGFNPTGGRPRSLTCLMERSCRFQAFQDDVHPLDRFLSWHRLQQDEGQTSDFGGAFVEDDGLMAKCNKWHL